MPANESLAAAQAALVRALVEGGDPPAGFEPTRLQAASRVLLDKRVRAAVRACPALRRELSPRLTTLFGEYARAAPPAREGAGADASRFLRWLRAREALPDGLRAAALELRLDGRRGVAVAWLPTTRRLLAGIRLSAARARYLSVTVPTIRHARLGRRTRG